MRKIVATLLAGLAVAALAGCSAPPDAETRECLDVPASIMDRIAEGANSTPISPIAASAVRSESFEDATIVAMSFEVDGAEERGVWAVGGSLTEPGLTLAIDAVSAVVTDWPNEMNGEKFDVTTDGASEALDCLAGR